MTTGVIDKSLFTIADSTGKLNIFKLTYPIILQTVFQTFIITIHSVLISRTSEDAVSAIGVTNFPVSALTTLLTFISIGSQILISYELGRGNTKKSSRYYSASLLGTAVLSVFVLAVVFLFSKAIIFSYGLNTAAHKYALSYFRIKLISLIITAILGCTYDLLRCYGKTLVIMATSVFLSVGSVGLGIVIVSMDISVYEKVCYFAWSSCLVTALSLVFSFVYSLKFAKLTVKISIKDIAEMSKVGFPGIIGLLSYLISMSVVSGFIAHLGTVAINAHVYVGTLTAYSNIFSVALRSSNSVMLGRLLGRKEVEKSKKFVQQNAIIAMAVNTAAAVVILAFGNLLMKIFTSNANIIRLSILILAIDIPIETARGFSHMYGESALVCAKDTVFAASAGIFTSWVLTVGGCYLVCNVLGYGLVAIRIIFAATEIVKGIIMFLRWKSEKWQKKAFA